MNEEVCHSECALITACIVWPAAKKYSLFSHVIQYHLFGNCWKVFLEMSLNEVKEFRSESQIIESLHVITKCSWSSLDLAHQWLKGSRTGPVMELGMWRMLSSSPCTALWRNPPRYSGGMRLPLQEEAVWGPAKSISTYHCRVFADSRAFAFFAALEVKELKMSTAVNSFQHFTLYFICFTGQVSWFLTVLGWFHHAVRLHVSLRWLNCRTDLPNNTSAVRFQVSWLVFSHSVSLQILICESVSESDLETWV